MKQIITMSIMALSSMTMFGGNIVKGTEPINSIVKVNNESSDQIIKMNCYKQRVLRRTIFPNGTGQSMVQVHEEYGFYTEQDAIDRRNELRFEYFDHTDGYGNQHIYLTGYSIESTIKCFSYWNDL